MKTILIAVLTLLSAAAHANEQEQGFALELGLGSVHATKRADGQPWNERNTGVALEYVSPGRFFGHRVQYCATAGEMQNSEFGETLFAGACVRKEILSGELGTISVGAFAGAMTYPSRYNADRKPGDIFPAILPTASACLRATSNVCLDATFIPKVQKDDANASAALFFSLRMSFY